MCKKLVNYGKGKCDCIFCRMRHSRIFLTVQICRSLKMRIMYISVRTIRFTEQSIKTLPNTKGKTLVADVSSCFLSEPVDVTKYGVIYGGVQKNIGPAGVVIAIIREDLITDDVLPGTPTMLQVEDTGRRRFTYTIHHLATEFISVAKYSSGSRRWADLKL